MVIILEDNELLYTYLEKTIKDGSILSKLRTEKNGEKFSFRSHFYSLKKLIDDFLNGERENRFIVLPGLRGVGKTTLIFQLYEYLHKVKEIDKNRILYLSMDYVNDTIGENIYTIVESFLEKFHGETPITLKKKVFLFVDEAQYDPDWSLRGKILYDQSYEIFMIFTGSPSLEFELNLDAARRTSYEYINPLNFKEYLLLKYKNNSPKSISENLIDTMLNGNIDKSRESEREIINILNLNKPYEIVWKNFLLNGGFPNTVYLSEDEIYKQTYKMIQKVVEMDIGQTKIYRNGTKNAIFKILRFLSLQTPGELSENKLSNLIGVSSSLIHEILTLLTKTQLIFPVTPYGGVGKQLRKPFKYYFLSPTLKASINDAYGWYSKESNQFLGILSENLVASTLYLMEKHKIVGLFYQSDKNGVDFIIKTANEKLIPIEVGYGNKDKKQVKNAMNKFNCDYGVIISNKTPYIKKEEDIIYIPLTTFSFI